MLFIDAYQQLLDSHNSDVSTAIRMLLTDSVFRQYWPASLL